MNYILDCIRKSKPAFWTGKPAPLNRGSEFNIYGATLGKIVM